MTSARVINYIRSVPLCYSISASELTRFIVSPMSAVFGRCGDLLGLLCCYVQGDGDIGDAVVVWKFPTRKRAKARWWFGSRALSAVTKVTLWTPGDERQDLHG